LLLRISESTSKIGHARRVLYHRRSTPQTVPVRAGGNGGPEPNYAPAVNAHLARCGISAVAAPHPSNSHRLTLRSGSRSSFPHVAVAIREDGTASAAGVVKSIVESSSYPSLAVHVPPSLSSGLPADRRIAVGELGEFHSILAEAEFTVWIDAGLEAIVPDWIETLLIYCEQHDVGCVAPLITHNGTVWSAGFALWANQGIDYAMKGMRVESEALAEWLSCSREVTAVSGECMMISTSLFRELGGSIKYYSSSALDGADLCMRAIGVGRRNILAPQAVLRKRGSAAAPRGWKLDRELFRDRWGDELIDGDSFYRFDLPEEAPRRAARAGGRT
jgi:hypothetical protein